jgi:hypothetical protein
MCIDHNVAARMDGVSGKVAMLRHLLFTAALLVPIETRSQSGSPQPDPDLERYFRQYIGLSQDQIASIQPGPWLLRVVGQQPFARTVGHVSALQSSREWKSQRP